MNRLGSALRLAGLLFALATAPPLFGQGEARSAHWGAITLPEVDRACELAPTFDRFTALTTPSGESQGKHRSYALRKTIGLNMLAVSCQTSAKRLPEWLLLHWLKAGVVRLTLAGGITGERPTEGLQNDFLHHFRYADNVQVLNPVAGTFEHSAGLDINWWYDNRILDRGPVRLNAPFFAGFGLLTSTVSHEMYVQAGVRGQSLRLGTLDFLTPSFVFRAAPFVHTSSLTGYGTVASSYVLVQTTGKIPLQKWWYAYGILPEIELSMTQSTGFFLDSLKKARDGRIAAIPERQCGIAFRWAAGDFGIETYNDTCGDKDQGPSFGVRTWIRGRRWPWKQD